MILPAKHIAFSESVLGLAAILVTLLGRPKKVEQLWEDFLKINDSTIMPAYHSADSFVLALDFLFVAGVLTSATNGDLALEAH